MQKFILKDFMERYSIGSSHPVLQVVKAISELSTEDGVWLAGGAVMALVQNTRNIKDFDFFFKSEEEMKFLRDNLEAAGAENVADTDNAVTYKWQGWTIQLITRRYYPSVEYIFDDFDFSISMFAIDVAPVARALYCDAFALWDLAKKELHIHNVNALGYTFKRVIKYGKKGFHIPVRTYKRLMELFSVHTNLEPEMNRIGAGHIYTFTLGSGGAGTLGTAGAGGGYAPDTTAIQNALIQVTTGGDADYDD